MPLGVALLQGGTSSMRYDTDVENIFRQESFFAYLFGALEPGLMGAVDLRTGMSLLFLPKQDEAHGPAHRGRAPTTGSATASTRCTIWMRWYVFSRRSRCQRCTC